MSLLQEWSPLPNSLAAIWHIEEPESFFSAATGLNATHVRHPERRIEHLAGRFLLQQLHADFPIHLIEKNHHGKPSLPGNEWFFSVSHSYPYVAAIISNEQHVGIDIQIPRKNIAALAEKFLSSAEQKIVGLTEDHLHLAWTAKEAVYKLQGLRGVDFKNHMPILNFQKNEDSYMFDILCNLLPEKSIARINSLKNSFYYHSIAYFHSY